MVINVEEAYKLEGLNNYIDEKEKSLNECINKYNELVRKHQLFLHDYEENINSLSLDLNKRLESIYNLIDSFEVSYKSLSSEIATLEHELLRISNIYDGDESSLIEAKLISKLNSMLDKSKNSFNQLLDSYLKKYSDTRDLLTKSINKLTKLKNRDIR